MMMMGGDERRGAHHVRYLSYIVRTGFEGNHSSSAVNIF